MFQSEPNRRDTVGGHDYPRTENYALRSLRPIARRNRVVHESGVGAEALGSRLHGPIGLDIGALTPESIALAIVCEIHAWLAGRGGVLND